MATCIPDFFGKLALDIYNKNNNNLHWIQLKVAISTTNQAQMVSFDHFQFKYIFNVHN